MGAYGPPAGFYRNKARVRVDPVLCTACMRCMRACSRGDVLGVEKVSGKPYVVAKNADNCVGCCRCVDACLTNAIGVDLV